MASNLLFTTDSNLVFYSCLVCLVKTVNSIDVFSENGQKLHINEILSKHLWFQCNENEVNRICKDCFKILNDFYDFYNRVAQIHATEAIKIESVETISVADTKPIIFESVTSELNEFKTSYPNLKLDNPVENDDDSDRDDPLNEESEIPISETETNISLDPTEVTPKSEILISNLSDNVEETQEVELKPKRKDRPKRKLNIVDEDDSSPDKISIPKPKLTRLAKQKSNIASNSEDGEESLDAILPKKPSHMDRGKIMEEDEQILSVINMKCDLCEHTFNIFRECKAHYRTSHQTNGYLICCGSKFFKRVRVVEHIQRHINPNGFSCSVCNRCFLHKKGLNLHMEKHNSELQKPFKCEKCPKTFAKNYQLRQHQIRHVTEKPFTCNESECGKSFANNSLLQYHIRAIHKGAYIHVCDICAKEFRSKCSYEQHYKVNHSNIKLPTVQCQICGTWLKHEISLRGHMQLHIQAENKYICNICGKQAPNRGALRSHQKYVHIDEKNFKCTVCDKAFKRELNLKEHMTTHTGDVLYTCPHCPKTFNSSANMHAHRKKLHPLEWEERRKKNVSNGENV